MADDSSPRNAESPETTRIRNQRFRERQLSSIKSEQASTLSDALASLAVRLRGTGPEGLGKQLAWITARLQALLASLAVRLRGTGPEALGKQLAWITARLQALSEERTFADQVFQVFDRGIASPMYQRYVDYALGSASRGREIAVEANRHRAVRGSRYLDVGSGWGGCLIAFAQAGAAKVVGLDVDERLVRISRANLAEHGVEADVAHADAMSWEDIKGHGVFDIITCTDVIEHVTDPPHLMEHLARLCGPGGIMLLSAPNRRSHTNVLADPHHGLFGSILLERDDSIRRFYEVRSRTSHPYTLGPIWDQEAYLKALQELGLEATILSHDLRCDGQTMQEIQSGFQEIATHRQSLHGDARISPQTRSVLGRAVDEYLQDLGSHLDRWRQACGKPGTPEAAQLALRYHAPVHRLLGRRPGHGPASRASAHSAGLDAELLHPRPGALSSIVWRMSDRGEMQQWGAACDRSDVEMTTDHEALRVRLRRVEGGRQSLYLYRPIGVRFAGRAHLGMEFQLRGWGLTPEVLLGALVRGVYYYASVALRETDEPQAVEFSAPHLRRGGEPLTGPLPPDSLFRVIVSGVPEEGVNEFVIHRAWLQRDTAN